MRILDRILGRGLEATGELGYFGLTGWWLSSFSKAQRDYMETAFCSSGFPPGAKPLTRDRGLAAFPTAAALLTTLADRLSEKPQDRGLACRILAKAEERALAEDDILGRHFVYHQMIRLHSRWKDEFADAVNLTFSACHKQIELAPDAARLLRQMRPTNRSPRIWATCRPAPCWNRREPTNPRWNCADRPARAAGAETGPGGSSA